MPPVVSSPALPSLVMSGDFVIGLIVFLILIVVNFIVITKGATRIAEVGARFTLDAIPGKQMSIDADLSAGMIDEKEAQRRRANWKRKAPSSARWTVPRSSCAATPSPAC
jgi:flagellar biosynthesis protein FlhA